MTVKYKLDNELDIVVLVVYQSIIQLSYADKLLTEVQLRFRDLYKNVLEEGRYYSAGPKVFNGFNNEFNRFVFLLMIVVNFHLSFRILNSMKSLANTPGEMKKPRTYQESDKSKKTVASMVETAADRAKKAEKEKEVTKKPAPQKSPETSPPNSPYSGRSTAQSEEDEEILRNRENFMKKQTKSKSKIEKSPNSDSNQKKGKQARSWGLGGKVDSASLNFADDDPSAAKENEEDVKFVEQQRQAVGKCAGEVKDLEVEEFEVDDEDEEESVQQPESKGWFSSLKSLVGNKQLTAEDIAPVLEKLEITLTGENLILLLV